MKHFNFLFALLGIFAANILIAQAPFSFTNANNKLSNSNFHSGNAISVADMNGDGLDDIARLDQARDLYYELQRTGQTFQSITAGSTSTSSNCWSMVVGDADNNGIRDVLVGYNGSIKFIKPDSALTSFPMVTLPNSNYFLQNMNFADIDNNGWADIFGCNDVGASKMYGNDGNGNFPATANFFSPATYPASDNSGNYGSIWTDFDNDGDVDLYVAHCRQGITSSTDPRRINQLFINQGNGVYVLDSFNVHGTNIGAQTWTASFEDIDNDTDFDLLITNHNVASQLFLNDGAGNFTDITTASGLVVNITSYQSKMADFDNDGYVDILIAGSASGGAANSPRFFRNNHDNTFTLVSGVFDNNSMKSFAVGDLNHDGKLDLYSSYASGYNDPSTIDDVLWLNTTNNTNHFITFDLRGTVSTRDALGARIFIYGSFGVQTREVRAGESYGTTNSFMCHFGLGAATEIDSAVVKWPSGLVTHLGSRPADQFITVVEGECSSPNNIVTANTPLALCGGQPLTVFATPGYAYTWNTGDTTQSITITTEGEYNVRITDLATGCNSVSKTIFIQTTPDETPTVTFTGSTTFCGGDSLILIGSTAPAYLWSNGDTTQSTIVKTSGTYTLTIQGSCAQFTSQPVNITSVITDINAVTPLSVCEGNTATIQLAVAGTAYWFENDSVTNEFNTGTTFTTPVLSENITYYVEARDTAFGLSGNVGPIDNSMNNGGMFNGDQYQIFDVYKTIVLKSVKVYAGSAKARTIQLRNAANVVVQQVFVNIDSGMQIVPLNWLIAPGTAYRLGWLAGSQPNLYRNSANASYPYTLNGLVAITGSSAGSSYYYAYYDWSVEEPPLACVSQRVPVSVTVNPNPVVSFTGLNNYYYQSDNAVMLQGTPAGGTFSGVGVTGNSFSPVTAGVGGPFDVTYTYTDGNGCSAASIQQVTVLADTASNIALHTIAGSRISVFPNPNNGSFYVKVEMEAMQEINIGIRDVSGRLVFETKGYLSANQTLIPVEPESLSGGYYTLTVSTFEGNSSFKLCIR
ncbi:MAG: VCBS repeat-containing protein [Chitinophagales bacterium]|nr:VCBS repeat-containing protein [Chitinophagales bacterium]